MTFVIIVFNKDGNPYIREAGDVVIVKHSLLSVNYCTFMFDLHFHRNSAAKISGYQKKKKNIMKAVG